MARQQLNESVIQQKMTSLTGPIGRNMFARGVRVQSRARQLCPVDTGRLRSSINIDITVENNQLVVRVGTSVRYARAVHDGTGIYGPRARPITPVHGQVLVFTPRGGQTVFVRSVRGQRAVPFLKNALPAAVA